MKKFILMLFVCLLAELVGFSNLSAQTINKTIYNCSAFTIPKAEAASPALFAYRWLENGTEIEDATTTTYTIVKDKAAVTLGIPSQPTAPTDTTKSTPAITATTNALPEYVTIAGKKWATRNVDAYQTFASNAHDYGKFYQWNRTTAYLATGSDPSPAWTETSITDTTWSANPCPPGWSIPSIRDFENLDNAGYYDATVSGVYGKWYGKESGCTLKTCIFLPAVGYRSRNGTLDFQGSLSYYWSSTQLNSTNGFALTFINNYSNYGYDSNKASGCSLRCVK